MIDKFQKIDELLSVLITEGKDKNLSSQEMNTILFKIKEELHSLEKEESNAKIKNKILDFLSG